MGGLTLDSKPSLPWQFTASQLVNSHNNSEAMVITIQSLQRRELEFREVKELS